MWLLAAPKTVVCHGQVEDQAPATRCVMEIVADNQLRYLNTVRSNRFDGEICLIDSFVIGFNT